MMTLVTLNRDRARVNAAAIALRADQASQILPAGSLRERYRDAAIRHLVTYVPENAAAIIASGGRDPRLEREIAEHGIRNRNRFDQQRWVVTLCDGRSVAIVRDAKAVARFSWTSSRYANDPTPMMTVEQLEEFLATATESKA